MIYGVICDCTILPNSTASLTSECWKQHGRKVKVIKMKKVKIDVRPHKRGKYIELSYMRRDLCITNW